MGKREYRKVPETLTIRLSDVSVMQPGTRSDKFTIATTLLDIEEFPSFWIGSLYLGRWIIEPDIRSIKCTMGIEHLRSQSPEAIERELWTGLLTYNLVRSKMLKRLIVSIEKFVVSASPKRIKFMTVVRRVFHAALAALTKIP